MNTLLEKWANDVNRTFADTNDNTYSKHFVISLKINNVHN